MNKTLFDRLIQQFLPEMGDPASRKDLIESALFGSPVLHQLQWDGAARPFTVRLVRQLNDYGEIAVGRLALVALLEEVKAQVGLDRQQQVDELIAQLQVPPAVQEISPPTEQVEGELYVFISYARPDQAEAAHSHRITSQAAKPNTTSGPYLEAGHIS